jgi:hypothetical protein
MAKRASISRPSWWRRRAQRACAEGPCKPAGLIEIGRREVSASRRRAQDKALFPGLRIGYAVVPRALLQRDANINLALIDLPALAYQCTHSRR